MGAINAYRSIDAPGARRAVDQWHSTLCNPAAGRAGVSEMTALHHSTALLAQERRQFRLIFGLAFVVFLVIALIARILPRRLRPWAPVGNRRLSFVAEAHAVTSTFIPFAFL
jgi:hypothetical protein